MIRISKSFLEDNLGFKNNYSEILLELINSTKSINTLSNSLMAKFHEKTLSKTELEIIREEIDELKRLLEDSKTYHDLNLELNNSISRIVKLNKRLMHKITYVSDISRGFGDSYSSEKKYLFYLDSDVKSDLLRELDILIDKNKENGFPIIIKLVIEIARIIALIDRKVPADVVLGKTPGIIDKLMNINSHLHLEFRKINRLLSRTYYFREYQMIVDNFGKLLEDPHLVKYGFVKVKGMLGTRGEVDKIKDGLRIIANLNR